MKELFEITKNKYLENVYNGLSEHKKEIWEDQINKPDGWIKIRIEDAEIAKHKVAIMDAIWVGLNVSDEVLKDYPDIIERFKNEIKENNLLRVV